MTLNINYREVVHDCAFLFLWVVYSDCLQMKNGFCLDWPVMATVKKVCGLLCVAVVGVFEQDVACPGNMN